MSGDTVLLYSGGLDSYAAARILQPDVLLHVRMGTAYGRHESERLTKPAGVRGDLVVADLPLAAWERPDAIIPGRNAHLVLLAANYGDTIWLGATAGDRVHDKDAIFTTRMNNLLRHLYAPQWWLPAGRHITVSLPIKYLTKRALVAKYLAEGGDGAALAVQSLSCYNAPGGRHCAACKPCVRKWVALVTNGIDAGYDATPYLREHYLPAITGGTWDRAPGEARDVLAAVGVWA